MVTTFVPPPTAVDQLVGVIVADTRLRIRAVHAGDGLASRIGWDPGELCDRSLAGRGVRSTWPELLPACVSAVGGETVTFEHDDGRRVHRVEVEPAVARGAIDRIVLTIHELEAGADDEDDGPEPPTPLRRTPLPLDDGTSLFWRGFAQAPTAMAIIDPVAGRFVRVNDALCALSGHGREQLLAGTVDDVLHPEDRGVVRDLGRGMAEGGDASLRFRRRYVQADGTVVPVEVHLIPVHPAHSSPTCLAHIVALDPAHDEPSLGGTGSGGGPPTAA